MKILLLLFLGLCAGCGTLIGSIARGGERTSSRARPPATGGFIAGSIVDLGVIGAGAYAVNKTGNAGSGALLTLEASDLLLGGAVRPMFSVAALVKLPICSSDSPIPGELKSLTLFDAVSSTHALRPEAVRYLTETVRARIGELLPALWVIAQSDFTPLSGTRALPDSCDVTCRLGVAQKLETAAAATAELTSEGGRLDYKLTVRMVKTGEVVASVRASGKDLVELGASVRAAAARLAGCRE